MFVSKKIMKICIGSGTAYILDKLSSSHSLKARDDDGEYCNGIAFPNLKGNLMGSQNNKDQAAA